MPCTMLAPVIERIKAKYDGQVTVAKVDVDAEPGLARQYNVMSIPTVIIFKDGFPGEPIIGVRPIGDYESFL